MGGDASRVESGICHGFGRLVVGLKLAEDETPISKVGSGEVRGPRGGPPPPWR